MTKTFEELSKIDVSEYVEEKEVQSKKTGKSRFLSYMSWAHSLYLLLKEDNTASWYYKDPIIYSDGSMMVQCCVTLYGKERCAFLPVLNFAFSPIKNPSAWDINNTMQRCFSKAVAMHGIGIKLYFGEDLQNIPETKACSDEKLAVLHGLLTELSVPDNTVNIWCAKENVSSVEAMSNYTIEKYILFLKKKLAEKLSGAAQQKKLL